MPSISSKASPVVERHLFGTDGIRGVANADVLRPELALRLGRAITHVAGRGKAHAPRILIGKDTRLSGYMLEQALAAGICSMGGRVILCGPIPTPAVAHLTTSMRADAGIVISASHNPYEDNGIKIFGGDGFKLPDAAELELEGMLADETLLGPLPTGPGIGRATFLDDARGRYVVFAKNSFPNDLTLDGIRVVVDAAHGAAYQVAPLVFRELGATVTAIGVKPSGVNINKGAGALHPDQVRSEVVKRGAMLGIALDGDADRLIVVRRKGPDRRRRRGDGDVRRPHDGRRHAERQHARLHGHVEPRSRARHPGQRRQSRAHASGRPLRRRGDAQRRLQPGRRAIRAF